MRDEYNNVITDTTGARIWDDAETIASRGVTGESDVIVARTMSCVAENPVTKAVVDTAKKAAIEVTKAALI